MGDERRYCAEEASWLTYYFSGPLVRPICGANALSGRDCAAGLHIQIFPAVTILPRILSATCALVLNTRRNLRPAVRGPLLVAATGPNAAQRFAMGSVESRIRVIGCAAMAAALLFCPEVSHADQGGGSFWFPGQFASLVSRHFTRS